MAEMPSARVKLRREMMSFIRRFGSRLAPSHGLYVEWHEKWNSKLGESLQSLPEMEDCSHELYRLLLQNPGPNAKPIALLTEKKDPVALVGLRQEGFHWVLVSQWLLPGVLFPVKPGYFVRAIEALGLELSIGWWRHKMPPPQGKTIRQVEPTPTYQLKLSDDLEQFWRRTKFMKTLRQARNRCQNFSFHINPPGALDWTVRNWHETWFDTSLESTGSSLDRLAVAQYLEAQGKHYTFSLTDEGKIISGATVFVQGNDLVAGVSCRDREYDRYGVGDDLLHRLFIWAADSRYDIFDLGGGHKYKKNWAPLGGHRWMVKFSPSFLYYPKQLIQRFRGKTLANDRDEP
jgi:hypothetical protein